MSISGDWYVIKMSDNESSTSDQTEKSVDQEPTEPSSPTRDEPSAETQSDSSTDVAPTRKTRRRPEHKPPPEEQKTPETQKPAESASDVSFYHTSTKHIYITAVRWRSEISFF